VVSETLLHAEWVRENVREVLRDADPSAWRSERAEELRRRVHEIVARMRARWAERSVLPSGSRPPTPSVPALDERLHVLTSTLERALPESAARKPWAQFVGEVHPEYEALVAALPTAAGPAVRPTNVPRSLFHLASAAVALTAVALLPSRGWLIAIPGTFAVYAWAMEIGRRFSPRLNDHLMRIYGVIAHPHERYRINSATWYGTALVLLALFATVPAMMAAVMVLGVADPVAAFVGRRWGRRVLRAGRSLEGTLAFFVSGTLAAAVVLALSHAGTPVAITIMALLAGGAGAIAELFATRLDDNFTIPLAVGAIATIATPLLA
jgi:dolichol kinase